MWVPRRLLTLLGVSVAAAFAALVLPTSVAHAAGGDSGVAPGWGGGPYETCNGAVCLVMEPLTFESLTKDWVYQGIRPFLTDWKGTQPYDVEYKYTPTGATEPVTVDAGSYNIKTEDFWNPLFTSSAYQFGDFTASSSLPAGVDPSDLGWYDDMSGASIYKVTMLNGALTNLTMNNVGPHDANYWVVSTPDMSYTVVSADGASAGYIQIGDGDPSFLWNSLFHAGMQEAQVPDYLIPNDPFSVLDFNPCDFVGGCDAPV